MCHEIKGSVTYNAKSSMQCVPLNFKMIFAFILFIFSAKDSSVWILAY